MQDDVLIVLNEREASKKEMALELESQLRQLELSASHLYPTKNIKDIITERKPRVLVLDYLLGDFTTAPDILTELRSHSPENETSIIIWTDEPSVSAAVQAIQMGAENYIEFLGERSLAKVLRAVKDCLKQSVEKGANTREANIPKPHRHSLISEAPSFKACLTELEKQIALLPRILILSGDIGSGRSTLARYCHDRRSFSGLFQEIQWDKWPHGTDKLFQSKKNIAHVEQCFLARANTLFIDHVEFDNGELLEKIEDSRPIIWQENASTNDETPLLLLGISDEETAKAWQKTLDCQMVSIPALEERKEDFLPLMLGLTEEARSFMRVRALEFSSELLEKLASESWPGNLRQLRSAALEGIATISLIQKNASEESDEDLLIQYILDAKRRWEKFERIAPLKPRVLDAKRAVEKFGGSYRLAAASLGTGVPQLREALGIHSSTETRERT